VVLTGVILNEIERLFCDAAGAARISDVSHRPRLSPCRFGKILTPPREPLEPPPLSAARGPPTDWGELGQLHDDRNIFQESPDELPALT